jgi:para-aminobenzoate synthetase component 1
MEQTKSIDELFMKPSFAISITDSGRAFNVFINPVSQFILPNGFKFTKEEKNIYLENFNSWVNQYRANSNTPFCFGLLTYEALSYTENFNFKLNDLYNLPSGIFYAYNSVLKVTANDFKLIKNLNLDISNNNSIDENTINNLVDYLRPLLLNNRDFDEYNSDKNIIFNKAEELKFIDGVKRIQQEIYNGNVYQANISAFSKFKNNLSDSQLFSLILQREKGNYSCYINCSDIALNTRFISNSPEKFLTRDCNTVTANPIKGTISTHQDKNINQKRKDTLLNSKKDKAELAMIVDLFRNDLGKVAEIGSVKVSEFPSIMELNNLFHLYSEITAKIDLNKVKDSELIFSCFPSGSITGAPKYTAIEYIYQVEQQTRGIFCGGFFSFRGNGFDSSVAIRTATLKDSEIYLRAGCGITIDSDPNEEFIEALNKARQWE